MIMEVEVEVGESAVPEKVMESVKRTLINVQELRAKFDDFLTLCDPEVLTDLSPLQRAQSLLALARLTTTVFALRLRCAGVHPEDHRVKGEIERIRQYQGKLERHLSLSKAPLRPTTTLNFQAATRVIEHSLPNLTGEQRQSLRELSKKETGRINYVDRNMAKKRKYQSPEKREKPSIQASAQEFLEKAARELLGDKQGGLKGPMAPILIEDSSEEESMEEQEGSIEDSSEEELMEADVKDAPDSAFPSASIVIDSSDGD